MKVKKLLKIYTFLILAVSYAQESNSALIDSLHQQLTESSRLYEQNKFGETIEICNKVLQQAIKIDDTRMQAYCYNMLGNSYFNTNDSLSFHYLFKAKDAFIKTKDTVSLGAVYNNIGANYIELGNINNAEKYFRKALDLTKGTKGQRSSNIYPLFNLADIAIERGNYEKGIQYVHKVLKVSNESKDTKNRSVVGDLYELLAYAHYKLENKAESELYFKKGEAFAKEHNYFGVLSFMYKRRHELLSKDKEYKIAYELLGKYKTVSDTLHKIEDFEKAKQIETDNFLRENKEKLVLAKKEQEYQKAIINKGEIYNLILVFFSFSLLLSMYFVYKKNKQFKRAKEDAENLSKVKSNFYSEISHELRTPLYAVIELSRLLLREDISKVQREYLESLNFSGNHLLSLINNVLELNKVESGQLKLQILNFKLEELINNIADSLEFALRDSHNKIHINYDKSIPKYLQGDSLKLSQLFINLVSNAIKFTNNGNIYVIAKSLEKSDTEVKIFFEVKDDGLGISKEKQKKVFEEFYQEHTKSKNTYNGTGLGLSIVKRILTAMDSEIHIESEVNEGAAFSFEIAFAFNETNGVEVLGHEILAQDLIGLYILIVDDNRINQLVTKKILNQLGIKCKTVNSGEEAIEVIKVETFDCILMDLHMPGLGGYETTNAIRIFNDTVPIVALTAASTEEVESKIHSCSMNGYVMKPFVISDFVETLHKSINEQSALVNHLL